MYSRQRELLWSMSGHISSRWHKHQMDIGLSSNQVVVLIFPKISNNNLIIVQLNQNLAITPNKIYTKSSPLAPMQINSLMGRISVKKIRKNYSNQLLTCKCLNFEKQLTDFSWFLNYQESALLKGKPLCQSSANAFLEAMMTKNSYSFKSLQHFEV